MRDNREFVVMTSAALAVLASPLQEAPGFPKCLEKGEGRERGKQDRTAGCTWNNSAQTDASSHGQLRVGVSS